MKLKLIYTALLILLCSVVSGQVYNTVGVTSWARTATDKGYFYRASISSKPGAFYLYTKQQIDSLNLVFAIDANVVHKTGNETIGGVKAFTFTTIHNQGIELGLASSLFSDASHGGIFLTSAGGGYRFTFSPITGINRAPFDLVASTSFGVRSYTMPLSDGVLAIDGEVMHNTGNESTTGDKTNSGAWSFGKATAPLLYTGNTNIAALSLVGFYNSAVNGNMLIGNNRSGSAAEIDFINAIGTSGSAIGGFRWSNVTTAGTEVPLLDINGSTKDITTYGRLFVGSIPSSATVANKYVTIDPTSGVLVYRTAAQILTDATNGRTNQVPLVSGVATITITGLTTGSHAFLQMVTMNGTASTKNYTAVCTTNTLTITAKSDDATTNTADSSVLNYVIIP